LSREQIIVRDHYFSLAEFFNNSFSVLNSAGAFTAAFIAIYPVNKYVAFAMLSTLLPRLWAQFAYSQDFSKLVDKLSDNNRQLEYLDWMYVVNEQIIEVKGLQQHESMMSKTMGLLMNKVNGNIFNSWSHLKRSVLVEGLDHTVMYGGILLLLNEIIKAPSTLAQSILPFYALTQFRDEMIGFANTLGEQANYRPFIRRIVGFMTKHSNDEDYPKTANKIDWKEKLPEVKLKNVSVKHLGAEEFAISDVNLTIRPGSVVAILGEIGSGKSTLVGAIEGRYRLASGAVFADDHNIQSFRQEWRTHTRRLDQNFCLFESLTFREILEMGVNPFADQAVKPEVEEVAKQTGLHKILIKKPAGYDTHNGEGLGKFSSKLSGGQAQLLALTRTMLGNPDIVFLDEPTASLDASRSQELEDFILNYLKGKTIFVVTHNMGSALKLADQVVWLESGKVMESASPQELLQREGSYFRKMFEQQSAAFNRK
jgi:ABC-type multidrug transport system fused ATPase/permease subunit